VKFLGTKVLCTLGYLILRVFECIVTIPFGCILYCGCFNLFCNVCVCVFGCFVLFVLCCLYCFVYVYLFLFVLSVLV
jgi:hypothetical protein